MSTFSKGGQMTRWAAESSRSVSQCSRSPMIHPVSAATTFTTGSARSHRDQLCPSSIGQKRALHRSAYVLTQHDSRPSTPPSLSTNASGVGGSSALTPASVVSTLVQSRDYAQGHLASQFYPAQLRQHFLAIRALDIELQSIRESVSSETLGKIRMGWWRDAVRGCFNNRPAKHPVTLALHSAIVSSRQGGGSDGLLLPHFERLITAREDELLGGVLGFSSGSATLDAVESHAEATSSRLLYLSLNLLGISDSRVDELFSHIGKAVGLTSLIVAIPSHLGIRSPAEVAGAAEALSATGGGIPPPGGAARSLAATQKRLVIPLEYLMRHGVVEEEVYRLVTPSRSSQEIGREAAAKEASVDPAAPLSAPPNLRECIFDFATRANDYLITARSLISTSATQGGFGGSIPAELRGPLASAVPPRAYLKLLEKHDFDVFHPELVFKGLGSAKMAVGWRLPWEMWRVSRTGTI